MIINIKMLKQVVNHSIINFMMPYLVVNKSILIFFNIYFIFYCFIVYDAKIIKEKKH